MTCDEINNYILDYLENDKTGRAIMLSGDWGCGKSHYVKGKLKSFIEDKQNGKYRCAIVSLYGLSDVSEISRAIYFELRTIIKPSSSEKGHTSKAVGKMIGKTILNGIGSKIGFDIANIEEEDLQKIYESVDLTDRLIVLEDFERTQIDTIKLLGFVNNLCESDGAKVLLVTNEKKLIQYRCYKKTIRERGEEKEVSERMLTEESKRYLEVKDKTVSDTLLFQSNIQKTINSIIEDFDDEELSRFKDVIKSTNRSQFINYDTNFREVIVACQKSINIFKFMNEKQIEADDEFKKCVFVGLVNYLQKRLDDHDIGFTDKSLFDSDLSGDAMYPLMRFCYDYYKNQVLNKAKIKKAVEEYEKYVIYVDKTSYEDCDIKVIYSMYLYPAKRVDNAIKNILKRLDNIKDISLNHYDRLINHLLIYKYDYHSVLPEIDDAINKMIDNLKGRGEMFKGKSRLFSTTTWIENEEGRNEIKNIENKIQESLNCKDDKHHIPDRPKINEIIDTISKDDVSVYNPNELISALKLNIMLEELPKYRPYTLNNLFNIFRRLNYEALSQESYNAISDFKRSVESLLEDTSIELDLVQKRNLKWVCNVIGNKFSQPSML